MKINIQDTLIKLLFIIVLSLVIGMVLSLIGIEIYVWVTYANTPISEIPSWALFFMFGNR